MNITDIDGVTALMCAAKEGQSECVKLLLNSGADVNIQNRDGTTALIESIKSNSIDCVNVLLGEGANINKQIMKEPRL